MNKTIRILGILTFVFLINNFSLAYTPEDFDLWLKDFKTTAVKKGISKQTVVNKNRKSRFRNAIKKMNLLIDGKKKDEALKFLPKLNSELMKIAKTGIIKKQNASRNVSRITKKIAAI